VRLPSVALALLAGLALACSGSEDASPVATPAGSAASPAAAAASSPATPVATATSTRDPDQRPLPAFEGYTLKGERVAIASLLGKRIVLFFFNPEVPQAAVAAKAVAAIAPLQGEHNFEIVGIGVGSSRSKLEAFVREQAIGYRVLDDSNGEIASRMQLRIPVAMIGADAEGYITFGVGNVSTEGESPELALEAQLRQVLRLPAAGDDLGLAEAAPLAPDFTAPRLEGGEDFRLSSLRGKPVILAFFLHTCPHCHHMLGFLKDYLPTLPADKRPVLIGIEISDRRDAVRARLKADGLDFFPVVLDPDRKTREAYGALIGVPDVFLVGADGRIAARVQGWRDDRDPPLMKMRVAKLAGTPVPMLLHQTGFSGNEFCAVCHTQQEETWALTGHAGAFDTLVRHAADRNAECVGCHVVGFGKPGGYTMTPPTRELEDVGCESCHGRGGPHLSPDFVKDGNYEPTCLGCHDAKHSLGFEYASFLPRISHAANAKLAALPAEEKRKILLARRKPRQDLLPANAAFVGSKACESCHAGEYATWAKGPHGHAVKSLEAKGEAGNAECLKCHTTGFGRTGGFPADGRVADHEGLANVGCESCHGPGAEHVKPGGRKVGTIVSLADKCDSCVILQICGSCHDDANDPGFEFEVKQKIEAQKHGTKPPAAGVGAETSAAAVIERAFAATEAR